MLFDGASKLVYYTDRKGTGQVQNGAGLFCVGEEDLLPRAITASQI